MADMEWLFYPGNGGRYHSVLNATITPELFKKLSWLFCQECVEEEENGAESIHDRERGGARFLVCY